MYVALVKLNSACFLCFGVKEVVEKSKENCFFLSEGSIGTSCFSSQILTFMRKIKESTSNNRAEKKM
jgi:hypothetical protein